MYKKGKRRERETKTEGQTKIISMRKVKENPVKRMMTHLKWSTNKDYTGLCGVRNVSVVSRSKSPRESGQGRVSLLLFPRTSVKEGVRETKDWMRPRRNTSRRTTPHSQ